MPNDQANLVHALQERIKELSCLYEISNIAATSTAPLPEKLQQVVEALPKAWQHPDCAVASLRLDDQIYQSGELPGRYETQDHPIRIRGQERGTLAMHYNYLDGPPPPFLHKEALLIRTLAQEIGGIIERDEQKVREALLPASSASTGRLCGASCSSPARMNQNKSQAPCRLSFKKARISSLTKSARSKCTKWPARSIIFRRALGIRSTPCRPMLSVRPPFRKRLGIRLS